MGTTDFSKFYSYNLGAFGSLDAKLTEGMKGIDYATSGPRSADFKKRYTAAYGKSYTDAWAPPFYDAIWIVATAINLANSLDRRRSAMRMWPAAYRLSGRLEQRRQGLQPCTASSRPTRPIRSSIKQGKAHRTPSPAPAEG